jgi:hypothetical protein
MLVSTENLKKISFDVSVDQFDSKHDEVIKGIQNPQTGSYQDSVTVIHQLTKTSAYWNPKTNRTHVFTIIYYDQVFFIFSLCFPPASLPAHYSGLQYFLP